MGENGLASLCAGVIALVVLPAVPSALDIAWCMGLCGVGFGFFQAPNMKAIMASAPVTRAGGASGIVATSRLLGQVTGVELVACCFMLAGQAGARWALMAAATIAAAGACVSLARLAFSECS